MSATPTMPSKFVIVEMSPAPGKKKWNGVG
jgi:hypothetical protein